MARKKAVTENTPVDTIRHADKRTNIPTEELRDFVDDDERAPQIMRYPRDTSLDPQLVWKGKDEQDAQDLEVPVLPIYIQEKIHPQVIIEDFLRHAKPGGVSEAPEDYQADLFADFNGLPEDFDQRVDFYHHEQNWANRLVLGDSLQVMTSLAEKEGLKGKVQMIYLDPPYGIKFNSNWQVSTRKREVKDGKADDTTRQPEQIRAFRDTWELGIHSYLAYLRDRFRVSQELLTESGCIFVQINSENSHLVRNLLDEIFGSENFVADIIFRKKSLPLGAKYLETMHDQILFYAKDINNLKFHHLFEENDVSQISDHGPYALFPNGKSERIKETDFQSPEHPDGTKYYCLFALLAPSFSEQTNFPYELNGTIFPPPNNGSWVVTKEKLNRLKYANRFEREGKNLRYRLTYEDFPYRKRTALWKDAQVSYQKTYVVQTAPSVIARCLLMTTDPGDIVLDPTCGSGTSAYVAEQWGRRWITIDTSRVALALTRTRLMSARFPYYFLADSPEGLAKEAEITKQRPPLYPTKYDIKKGFVYKRVPHITLKSIANNEDIDAIYEKYQAKLEPLRASINNTAKKQWQEWEIPREAQENEKLSGLLSQWWTLRQQNQNEIDASIMHRADMEMLYDKPYDDPKRIRVTGPFTVESLSPHRILPADENMDGTVSEKEAHDRQDFTTIILDNLRKSGVDNRVKNERIKFASLDPFAGKWIHAKGTYTDAEGITKSVGISIGPEHGTVGPLQVKEAAKEAVQGLGFDLLIVCGFAFDPHISDEMKRYGKLTVLPARMNNDLSMDELLKKTGTGNLFVVFGEPDIAIKKQPGKKIVVEIKGVDVYDPTTGAIRSNSTDDIACWFIDTDYNGESFFVRHAYFTGDKTKDPYEKLKRALKAEIDEAAWESLYRYESLPFAMPETGKIAVKVINHYGDEVMKVYPV
ncbi:MAG: site-specific DNA-methyltransferase [Methanoregula sp.]|nr:site-specific DNA-methyltransferase [Methanoregula sp.]